VLKKKENAEFSHKAGEIIKEFAKDKSKSSNELKQEPKSKNCVPKKEQKSEKEDNHSKKKSTISSASSSHKKLKSSESTKRLSEIESEQLRISGQKKPKLSLQDYKKSHIIKDEFDMFDKKYNNDKEEFDEQTSSTTGSFKAKYEKYSNENEYLPYNPSESDMHSKNKSKTIVENTSNKLPVINSSEFKKSKHESTSSRSKHLDPKLEPYVPEFNSEKTKQSIVIPPVPSMSLEDLFGDSALAKSEPYEPKIVNQLGPRAATSIRPSSYTPTQKSIPPEKTAAEIDEALSLIMRQKQSKRMIYTGKKTNGSSQPTVPKLYDLCSKTLVDNLDTLPSKIATYSN